MMAVYLIIEIAIKEPGQYKEYVERVSDIVKLYGGKYLIRGGKITPFSGNWDPERVILIEFESIESLRQCFESPEYLKLAPLRLNSTTTRAIIAEGVPGDWRP